MRDDIEKKRLAILRILNQTRETLSSQRITEELIATGYKISERTVRFHLLAMDQEGLTHYIGKHGRRITEKGSEELSRARIHEKVGFLSARINQMIYRMSFRLATMQGTVIVNISLIQQEQLPLAGPLMTRVFEAGYAMGTLLTLFASGEQVGHTRIPEGYVGIGTVCSITLNGVLLEHGIPTHSRFGGMLSLHNGTPERFTAIINYDGTSLDPLEIFIKSGMTDYLEATRSGNGQIGAGFREVPAASLRQIEDISEKLTEVGLGAIMAIGKPGQPLFEIPVSDNNIGLVVIGGLNPIAILEESGIRLTSRALSGLVDYNRLFPFQELPDQIEQLKL